MLSAGKNARKIAEYMVTEGAVSDRLTFRPVRHVYGRQVTNAPAGALQAVSVTGSMRTAPVV